MKLLGHIAIFALLYLRAVLILCGVFYLIGRIITCGR